MADYISRKAAVDALTKVALCVASRHSRAVATCINGIELLPAADENPGVRAEEIQEQIKMEAIASD